MIDEEVQAVILAILVVASAFAASQLYLKGRAIEPLLELDLLGPKIADALMRPSPVTRVATELYRLTRGQ